MLIKIALVLAPFVLVGLSALPKFIIQWHSRRLDVLGVADFRSSLESTVIDDEQVELDERWERYWAQSDRDGLVLATRLVDYAADQEALVERFAGECEQIIKQFTEDAVVVYHRIGNDFGGWKNDIEREAAKFYTRAGGDIHVFSHQVAVEVAECTDTQWSHEDARQLAEYINAQEVRS